MTTFLRRVLWPAIALLVALTVITGAAYPGARHRGRPGRASPTRPTARSSSPTDGRTVGSSLIGQCFDQRQVLLGPACRPPARPTTTRAATTRSGSAGSNLGPTSQDLLDRIDRERRRAAAPQRRRARSRSTSSRRRRRASIPTSARPRPSTRSRGSRRPAGMTEDDVRAAVARHTEQPLLGFLGQPRVHVLELNLDLDGLLQ